MFRRNLSPQLNGGRLTQPVTLTITAGATPTAKRQYVDNLAWFWVKKSGLGTPAIDDDFNCSSITDTAVGQFTPNIATAFANATYGGGHGHVITTDGGYTLIVSTKATTSFLMENRGNYSASDALSDTASDFMVVFSGDN